MSHDKLREAFRVILFKKIGDEELMAHPIAQPFQKNLTASSDANRIRALIMNNYQSLNRTHVMDFVMARSVVPMDVYQEW